MSVFKLLKEPAVSALSLCYEQSWDHLFILSYLNLNFSCFLLQLRRFCCIFYHLNSFLSHSLWENLDVLVFIFLKNFKLIFILSWSFIQTTKIFPLIQYFKKHYLKYLIDMTFNLTKYLTLNICYSLHEIIRWSIPDSSWFICHKQVRAPYHDFRYSIFQCSVSFQFASEFYIQYRFTSHSF